MKYFDKTFFKFALGFLCIICASLLIIYIASGFVGEEHPNDDQTAASQ